jgi:suppressor for copper-sensitivity B
VTEQATVSLLAGEYKSDGTVISGLHFKLAEGWKIYWREAGDTGFPPKLDWSNSQNIQSMDMLWIVPKRERYKISDDFQTESYEYSNEVLFPLQFVASEVGKEVQIELNVDYAICNDICIPANAKFNINVAPDFKSAENLAIIEKFVQNVPKENGAGGVTIGNVAIGQQESGEKYLQILVNSEAGELQNADIFVEGGADFAFYNPISYLKNNGKEAIFNIQLKELVNNADIINNVFKITLANGSNSVEREVKGSEFGVASGVISEQKQADEAANSKWIILLFAFLGGLILNVMPCVLPVLSIKLLSVIKHGGGKNAHVVSSFLITALGIVGSFVALGVFVSLLKSIGVNVGWGFHFQEPLFIITLVVILALFAANMWGFYEFRLPTAINDNAYKKSEGNNLKGHFFTGVFATVLATPCTAPFLGTAVGFAITGSFIDIFLVFLSMGIGMALPYFVFSLFPKVVTKLPAPGYWMVIVKNIMGVFIAITAIWLIWVLSSQMGKISAISLSAIILLIMLKLRFKLVKNNKMSFVVLILMIITAFVVPLKIAQKHTAELSNKQDLWQDLQIDEIQNLVDSGKVVFVDVTANWCLTCKVNKFLVLDNDELIKQFKEHDVVAMRADWTNRDENIANYLKKYNRAGIPFNIIYGKKAPEGIVMSELLSIEDVVNSIKKAKGN